jgi:hypothetical protein
MDLNDVFMKNGFDFQHNMALRSSLACNSGSDDVLVVVAVC